MELGAFDAALHAVPGVTAGVVVAYGEPARMAVFYCAGADLEEEIHAALVDHLPGWMARSPLYWLPALPLAPDGRTDRRALAALAASSPELEPPDAPRAPRNAVEEDLVERFARHLGLPEEVVGIDGDFFALGGHAPQARLLLREVNRHWHASLHLADLTTRPTVAELSRALPAVPAGSGGGPQELAMEVPGNALA
jgi:hypothetical protein